MDAKSVELLKAEYFNNTINNMGFSVEEAAIIKEASIIRQFKKGAFLLRAGQFSINSYFIIKGLLRSYYLVDGEEKVTDFYIENEVFSPTSTVTHKKSEQYLVCMEDCLVSIGTPEIEKAMMEKFPRFEKLCRIFSEELLVKQKSDFDNYKIVSAEQRYINLSKTRADLLQRVPQYQLASYLGITPQSLSRIRKRLVLNKPESSIAATKQPMLPC